MCRGIPETNWTNSCEKIEEGRRCELCGSRATLYCLADDSYLCNKCDKWVHEANFLALRHMRRFLCSTCQNLTRRCLVGASYEVVVPSVASFPDQTHCGSDHIDVVEGTTEDGSGSPELPFQFL